MSAPVAEGPRKRRGKQRINLASRVDFDPRSSAARALSAGKRALLDELGPENAGRYRVGVLVDVIVRTKLYVDHLDGLLLSYRTLLNSRRHPKPQAELRDRLVDRLQGLLVDLERLTAAKPAPDEGAAGVERILAKYRKPQEQLRP